MHAASLDNFVTVSVSNICERERERARDRVRERTAQRTNIGMVWQDYLQGLGRYVCNTERYFVKKLKSESHMIKLDVFGCEF